MVKIIIVTGFLGSGKTTFLKQMLNNCDEQVGILINEIGKIGLDDKLLTNSVLGSSDTLLLSGGCVCCNKLDEIKKALSKLINANEKLRYIIIETTGVANIAPIVFTILSDIFLSNHFKIHKIITCIDALNYQSHIKNEEAINQITSANEIIVTKTDLNENFDKKIISNINKSAFIYTKEEYSKKLFFDKNNSIPFTSSQPSHQNNIININFEFKTTLNWEKFCIWLSLLLHKHGTNILRIKGILDVGESECVSINGVYHHIYPSEHISITPKQSTLILIFKNIDKNKIINSFAGFLNLKENDFIVS